MKCVNCVTVRSHHRPAPVSHWPELVTLRCYGAAVPGVDTVRVRNTYINACSAVLQSSAAQSCTTAVSAQPCSSAGCRQAGRYSGLWRARAGWLAGRQVRSAGQRSAQHSAARRGEGRFPSSRFRSSRSESSAGRASFCARSRCSRCKSNT